MAASCVSWHLGVASLALVTSLSGVVRAQERQDCLDAYESSQQHRQEGKLQAARDELLICVQSACPDFVRPDCERWLGEVNELLPTVVVAAKGPDGADTSEVRVSVDGQVVAERLDGRGIPMDPGPHQLRFEHAGAPPKEQAIVVQQGVKNRVIAVNWAPPAPAPEPAPPPPPPERGQPVVAYVLGGLGIAALGSFAAFAILGKREADDLNARCGDGAPPGGVCTQDEIDATRTKLVVADVSLGVGAGLVAVGLGLLIYPFASEPDDDAPALRVDLVSLPAEAGATRPGGAYGSLTLPF